MKKLTLSLVAAGLAASSFGAYAAVPTGAAPFQVVVPNLKSGVEFTLEGLYLQPSNSDLTYAVTNTSGTTDALVEHTIRPKYNLGFRAALGYVFPNSGNDVQVAYTRFHRNNTNAIGFDAEGTPGTIRGSATFNYDAVDLDVGQYVNIGTRLQTRGFIGLRGMRLESTKTLTQSVEGDWGSFSDRSRFTGVGPRVGIDSVYHVGNCFGVVAHFATALLVGDLERDASFENSSTSVPTNTIRTSKQRRVVPGFDAKLGVDYTIKFPNQTSSMSIEAGYQATHYAGVVDRYSPNDTSTQATSAAFSSTLSSTSGVSFNGPYLSLNFKI